jgi:hypothetical protein
MSAHGQFQLSIDSRTRGKTNFQGARMTADAGSPVARTLQA